MRVLRRDEVRRIDEAAVRLLGISSLVLMENAARGLVEVVLGAGSWKQITIVAGPGNNGGDGLAAARLLLAEGFPAADLRVLLIRGGRALSEDAAANLSILQRGGVLVEEPAVDVAVEQLQGLDAGSLIVDALLGTGVRGPVRSPFLEVIGAMNRAGAARIAVDVPSGMDCDSGEACGEAVYADHTVTFVALKPGFLTEPGSVYCGTVHVRQIGIPVEWV
ncbi:MAG: Nicotinamide nucleotide repair protein [Planctomycetota bacterium]|jgi:NAD(P)H-hydrate epimerase